MRAWIITADHINTEAETVHSRKGWEGPRHAPDSMLAKLRKNEGYHFKMFDDDGNLYYEGRAIWDDDSWRDESGPYGPLGDLGMPDAGCTYIRYPGHPEFDCE